AVITRADTVMPVNRALTEFGVRIGTPDYMSPEQVLGRSVDERSDLFSFGILLCELFTGRHPFRRTSSSDTMAAILQEEPTIPSDVAVDLSDVLGRLLAKAPRDRYATITDARNHLGGVWRSGDPSVQVATMRAMVGRDQERMHLLRGLEAAVAGRGSIVLVGG